MSALPGRISPSRTPCFRWHGRRSPGCRSRPGHPSATRRSRHHLGLPAGPQRGGDRRPDRRRRTALSSATAVDEIVVIDDGSTDGTAADAPGRPGARVVAGRRRPPGGRSRLGQGQRAVEVALRMRRRHRLLARRRHPQLPPHFVTGLVAPAAHRRRDRLREGATTRGRSHGERRPAAAASPSSSPARCCRSCSRSSPASCSRSPASTRAAARLLEALPFVEGWGVELGLLIDVVGAVRASTRSRRSTSTCASTATVRSPSSDRRRWPSS